MFAVSDGHRTTCIQRPRDAARAPLQREPDPSRFAEFTRPIAKDKQLVKGRGKRLLFALVAVVIAAALAASLFVLPVKSWFQQRDDLARKHPRYFGVFGEQCSNKYHRFQWDERQGGSSESQTRSRRRLG